MYVNIYAYEQIYEYDLLSPFSVAFSVYIFRVDHLVLHS